MSMYNGWVHFHFFKLGCFHKTEIPERVLNRLVYFGRVSGTLSYHFGSTHYQALPELKIF